MDINEHIRRVDMLIAFLQGDFVTYAKEIIANDTVAMVTNRVVQRGEDYQGRKFSPYSEKKVSALEYANAVGNASAKRKAAALGKKGGVLSYKEWREMNNRETSIKNFEFTGEMWRKFGVIKTEKTGIGFVITIGGTTPAAQQKIEDNSYNENISIIEPNSQEVKFLEDKLKVKLNEKANEILNG